MDRKDAPIYEYVARLEAREKAQKKKRALTGILFLVLLVSIFVILSKFESDKQFTEAALEDLTPHQVRTLLEKDKLGLIVNHNYGEDTVLDMEGYFRLLEELAQKESSGSETNPDDEWIYESESIANPSVRTDIEELNSQSDDVNPYSRQNSVENNANKRMRREQDIVFQDEGITRSGGQQAGGSEDGRVEIEVLSEDTSGIELMDKRTSVVALPAIPRLRAEKMPYFPGGEQAIQRYIYQNKRIPAEARRNQIRGTVYVRFIVKEDGSVGYPKVIKGLGYGCDEEALRLVRHMPRWEAGRQDGRRVPVYETLAVTF